MIFALVAIIAVGFVLLAYPLEREWPIGVGLALLAVLTIFSG